MTCARQLWPFLYTPVFCFRFYFFLSRFLYLRIKSCNSNWGPADFIGNVVLATRVADIPLVFSLSPQRRYSPGWATASFNPLNVELNPICHLLALLAHLILHISRIRVKSLHHPSWFRATTFQFLHPSLATSSSTPSSQRSLGLPLGRFPPGSLRRTLLDRWSSWRMTCPAHLSLLNLQNFTLSFSPHRW